MATSATSATGSRHERDGGALAVLASAGFAGIVVMAKLGYAAGANPVTLLTVRFAIAAALLWALAAHRGVARVPCGRAALAALALGGLVYSLEVGLLFASLTRLDASLAELLVFSYPALVVLGAIALRHEPPARRGLAALGISTAGVALVLAGGRGGALDPLGVVLALGAAVFNAAYVLVAGRIGGRMHALTFAALMCSGTAVALALAGAASGSLRPAMSAQAWLWATGLAVVSTVVALAAFLGSIARLGAGRASILAMLEPPIACLLAFLVFGERLAPAQLAGGALVVAGALVLQLRRVRSTRRGAPALPAAPAAARAFARHAAGRAGVGVRAEVGRLPRARVRGRRAADAPVARR